MYGGSLSARRLRARDDLSIEFEETDLDQRLPASTRGSVSSAAARLAELGVTPGPYSGAEQVFAPDAASMTAALEPSACTIRPTGSLAITSRATGETTTFTWMSDRWSWSPYPGVTLEATPRRLGAVLVIDVVAWDGHTQRPAARLYLAADSD